jgi:hypothetical protein
MASQSIEVYVKNMVGEILTLSCSEHIDIYDFYVLVHQSLPEPRPPISSLRLLQKRVRPSLSGDAKEEEEDDGFSPLLHILDQCTIFLFIEDFDLRVEFLYHQTAVVERHPHSMNYAEPLFMAGENFHEYTLRVFNSDELLIEAPFFTRVSNQYDENFFARELYSDIYYHKDDVNYEVSRSMRWNELDEDMISIKDDATCFSSPSFFANLHPESHRTDAIANKIHQVWMEMVTRVSDGVLHPYFSE